VFTLTQATSVFTVTNESVNYTISYPTSPTFNYSSPNYTFTSTTNQSMIRTENLASSFKGEFAGGTRYLRGDTVRYQGAVYVADIDPDAAITSAVAPPSNSQWKLIFSQIGNMTADQVRALVRSLHLDPWNTGTSYQLYDWTWSTATNRTYVLTNIGGALGKAPQSYPQYWTNIGGVNEGDNATLHNLTVTNQLTVAGVKYPTNNGNLGQVLTTNGENQAVWADVAGLAVSTATYSSLGVIRVGLGLKIDGDGTLNVTSATDILRYWNLSSDLTTNGFDIVTGQPTNVSSLTPVPQLTIGSGARTKLQAGLVFPSRTTSTTGVANLIANQTVSLGIGLPETGINGNYVRVGTDAVTVSGKFTQSNGDIQLGGNVYGASNTAALNIQAPIVHFVGTLTGAQSADPVKVGISGVRFYDGSSIYSGNVLTLNTLTVNSTATINNIVVGAPGIKFSDGTVLTSTNAIVGGTGTGTTNVIAGVGITTATSGTAVVISLSTATTSTIGGVKIGDGIQIKDSVASLSTATTSTLGGVKIGEGLQINPSGVVSINFTSTFFAQAGPGLSTSTNTQTGALIFSLTTATTSTIGGVVVGRGMTVNTSTALLNLNTATSSTFGGVVIGNGLDINTLTAVVSLTSATGTQLGGVKIGDGLTINSSTSVVTLTTASATQLGGIKVGTNLSIFDGVLSASSSVGVGAVDLGRDMTTNGWNIRYNTTTNTSTYLQLNTNSVVVSAGTSTARLSVANNNTQLIGSTSSQLTLNGTQAQLSGPNSSLSLNAAQAQLRHTDTTYLNLDTNSVTLNATTQSYVTLGNNSAVVSANTNAKMSVTDQAVFLRRNTTSGLTVDSNSANLNYSSNGYAQISDGNIYLKATNSYITANASLGQLKLNSTTYLELNNNSSGMLRVNGDNYLSLASPQTILANPVQVNIQSPLTQFGSLYNSSIFVGAIWNYSGTGAPLFPEGTQYGDLTVQKTAFIGYDQGLIP
jgi:hypothetical protein